MSTDRLIGLAYVAERRHSGQRLQPKDEWEEARVWAAHYLRFARRNPKAF